MKYISFPVFSFIIALVSMLSSPVHAAQGKVIVFIRPDLHAQLNTELYVYSKDLRIEGYEVPICSENWQSARQMKDILIRERRNNLKGCLLVGNVPVPYLLRKGIDSRPCPLYLMDLDGIWDLEENGCTIRSMPEWPQCAPEIWAGFIVPNSSSASESSVEVIKEYFNKVHRYRMGQYKTRKGAFSFIDDPWKANATMGLEAIYGNDVTVVNNVKDSTASRLKKELAKEYEFVQIVSHNWGVDGIGILNNGRYEIIRVNDFSQIKPRALFYNLGQCSTCCYTLRNYLGGCCLFGPCDGLVVFGTTMPGLLNSVSALYQKLGKGETFGDAYKAWFYTNIPADMKCTKRKWYIGAILLGDPTLTVKK